MRAEESSSGSDSDEQEDERNVSTEYDEPPDPVPVRGTGMRRRGQVAATTARRKAKSQLARGQGRAMTSTTQIQPPINQDPLDDPDHAQIRRDLYRGLFGLVYGIRRRNGEVTLSHATYQWPPLVLRITRCRYPSSIRAYTEHKEPDLIFTDNSFTDLFK